MSSACPTAYRVPAPRAATTSAHRATPGTTPGSTACPTPGTTQGATSATSATPGPPPGAAPGTTLAAAAASASASASASATMIATATTSTTSTPRMTSTTADLPAGTGTTAEPGTADPGTPDLGTSDPGPAVARTTDPDPRSTDAGTAPGTAAPVTDGPPASRPSRRASLGRLGPNWYASVMGTGIVANSAAVLPGHVRGLDTAATLVWAFAATCLVVLVAGSAIQWLRHRHLMRGHLLDAAMAPFHGAIPMAFMTVGAGTLVFGADVLGRGPALWTSAVLWTVGTLLGIGSAVVVPYVMVTRHELHLDRVQPTWLLPVVPPMVSAATGAALVPHLPDGGQLRLTLVLVGWALFGATLLAMLAMLPLVWARLVFHGTGPAAAVPAMWIVLGPLGQSVTAAGALGLAGRGVLPAPYDEAMSAVPVVYGLPVFGFALLWLGLATALTARTARSSGLPFAMSWWAFTFPVGTCVTGAAALGARMDSVVLDATSVLLFGLLVVAWGVVTVRTARGVADGRLLPRP